MGINKVVVNDVVKLDLTADTVSPSTLATGITAHDKSGELITGTMESGSDDLLFSGNLQYYDYYGGLDNFITQNYSRIKLGNENNPITDLSYGFANCSLTTLPTPIYLGSSIKIPSLFNGALHLTTAPTLIFPSSTQEVSNAGWDAMFQDCYSLESIPVNYLSPINTTGPSVRCMFQNCYSLKTMLDSNITLKKNNLIRMFENCYSLKSINLSLSNYEEYNQEPAVVNIFDDTFYKCHSLSSITFNCSGEFHWGNTVLFLSETGYLDLLYYGGYWITKVLDETKCVKDETTYNNLKDTDDWWAGDYKYSRYDRQSAIATFNSLPDTSAYLDTQTNKTNTIMLKAGAGSGKGDLYNMSNLTAEEIAVATAKGWTVSIRS